MYPCPSYIYSQASVLRSYSDTEKNDDPNDGTVSTKKKRMLKASKDKEDGIRMPLLLVYHPPRRNPPSCCQPDIDPTTGRVLSSTKKPSSLEIFLSFHPCILNVLFSNRQADKETGKTLNDTEYFIASNVQLNTLALV